MWRPRAQYNNIRQRQHNGQQGTRMIHKIGLDSPRNPKFGERNIRKGGCIPRCTLILELDTGTACSSIDTGAEA